MTSLFRRTAANDDGNILITVVLVSMIVGMLASLALVTGTSADRRSSSDRNHEAALGVAEAGVQQVISRISAEAAGTDTTPPNFWSLSTGSTSPSTCHQGGTCAAAKSDTSGAYSFNTPQGKYWYWVTRITNGFVVDTQSTSGGTSLGRGRHVQVMLLPPERFPGGHIYAMFSYTNIVVQNNDSVLNGDIFANDSIFVDNSNVDPTIDGSITSARSWVQLAGGVHVTGNVWSGGYNQTQLWAMNMGQNSKIDGYARASNTDPSATCSDNNYSIVMAGSARIVGNLTTLASNGVSGLVGSYTPHTCTNASPFQNLPTFTFNRNNYDQSTYHEFSSVSAFQSWLSSNLSNFRGTFVVNDTSPSQTNRIDLTAADLTGPTTIVTNAPIYTGSLDDSLVTDPNNTLVLVSHYAPPTSTSCDTEHDTSDCAVHIKNNFSLNANNTCKTATLVYADLGPVAIKNSGTTCGSVISDGILVKNGLNVTYDDRITRVVGFGPNAYAIVKWEELPVS